MKHKINYIEQKESHTCGLAASKMILNFYGKSTYGLRKELNVDHALPRWVPLRKELQKRLPRRWRHNLKGTLPGAIIQAFEKQGLLLEPYYKAAKLSRKKLINTLHQHLQENLILALVDSAAHWVILYGTSPKFFHIADPGWEAHRQKKEKFVSERLNVAYLIRAQESCHQ